MKFFPVTRDLMKRTSVSSIELTFQCSLVLSCFGRLALRRSLASPLLQQRRATFTCQNRSASAQACFFTVHVSKHPHTEMSTCFGCVLIDRSLEFFFGGGQFLSYLLGSVPSPLGECEIGCPVHIGCRTPSTVPTPILGNLELSKQTKSIIFHPIRDLTFSTPVIC